MIRKLMDSVATQKASREQENVYRNLIRTEAKIGGSIFGHIPEGFRSEFFCYDANTWYWHKEYVDANGERQTVTTRYDVRPDGILKSQGDKDYTALSPKEARNLIAAAKIYRNRTFKQLYRVEP